MKCALVFLIVMDYKGTKKVKHIGVSSYLFNWGALPSKCKGPWLVSIEVYPLSCEKVTDSEQAMKP